MSGKDTVIVPEKKATRTDWPSATDMPERHIDVPFHMDLTPEQIDTLSWGHRPFEMEDKWFTYMEDGILHIHRSWTGNCIFEVRIGECGEHVVRINRDPMQYKSDDHDKDLEMLANLIRIWSSESNDPYGMWLDETADNLGRGSEGE